MKRREFVKLAAIAPIAPLSLVKSKPEVKLVHHDGCLCDCPDCHIQGFNEHLARTACGCDSLEEHEATLCHLKMWTNQHDFIIAKTQKQAEDMLVEVLYGENAWRWGEIPFEIWDKNRWRWDDDLLNTWGLYLMPKGNIIIYKDEIEGDGWVEMSMNTKFSLYNEDSGNTFNLPVKDYIKTFGEGYFASTEY
jgi:hypothetical protein